MTGSSLSWFAIARLGLVQTALGSIVVLTTSTINRVMVVELALPAMVPGVLVSWHYALQVLRPRWGHGSDLGRKRTPWIIGGMLALALGGFGAAVAVAVMTTNLFAGFALAVLAFTFIGGGVGAAGTSLLVVLATMTDERRRPAAATIVWIMMIAGFIVTAAVASQFLDPFSPARLVAVASVICTFAMVLTLVAVWDVEGANTAGATTGQSANNAPFTTAFKQVWQDRLARRFAIFVFVSMLAYSAQDLVLEPFAGLVFSYTPGQSTALSGVQNSGVLLGMLLVGFAATWWSGNRGETLRLWTVGGCVASAVALTSLVAAATVGASWPLKTSVFMLGFTNGMFAVAAIGSMFSFASEDSQGREGIRMGLFGASQAIAFGLGGFMGTALVDVTRFMTGSPVMAFASVFATEAIMFLAAALLAHRLAAPLASSDNTNPLALAAGHRPTATGS